MLISTHRNLLLVRNLAAVGFVHEHEPVAGLAFLHLDHCIVRVSEGNLGKKVYQNFGSMTRATRDNAPSESTV
jgi:hypothetical protein